jgi:hypothetical protein
MVKNAVIIVAVFFVLYVSRSTWLPLTQNSQDLKSKASDQNSSPPSQDPDSVLKKTLRLPLSDGRFMELDLSRPSHQPLKPMVDLLGFLHRYQGHLEEYVLDKHDCKHFAYELFQALTASQFTAHFVAITLQDQSVGHALVGVDTLDQERILVDVTPAIRSDSAQQRPMKVLAWAQAGDPYIRYPLDKIGPNFSNHRSTFLKRYESEQRFFEAWQLMFQKEKSIDEEKADLQQRVEALKALSQEDPTNASLDWEIETLQAQLKRLNSGIQDFNDERAKLLDELKNRGYTSDSWRVKDVVFF